MRLIFISLFCLLLVSCGTVAPRDTIDDTQWIKHDHKTDYFVRYTSDDTAYLTVRYASYTFLDKSTEMLPTAKSVFISIAEQISNKRQRYAVVDTRSFYESVAYNGVTGVSTVLVSNDVRFAFNPQKTNDIVNPGSTTVIVRLEQLDKAFKAGLITKQEYDEKRRELLKQFSHRFQKSRRNHLL